MYETKIKVSGALTLTGMVVVFIMLVIYLGAFGPVIGNLINENIVHFDPVTGLIIRLIPLMFILGIVLNFFRGRSR